MSSKVFEIWVLLVTSTIITLSNQSCISKWFDRDNPGGNGDYELLADLLSMFPGEICPNPIDIEAQTTSGQPASQTGNVFQVYNPTTGFSCVNANQGGGVCADYKVRFTCPEEWCSKCRTPWFDRDNPGGVGDYETLSLTLVTYPHQACAQPIAIEVTTISGTPVLPTGNSFQVYDPTEGFACVNAQQTGGCQDYRVRFTCLKSFCLPKCVTRWFDSDNPNTNGGDSELLTTLLSLYPGYICPNPLGIEAQTISGLPASQTGNVFQVYNPTTGFSCVNANQGGGVCADYKVRFTCPEEWCSKCRTPWFDRDNPGGVGDYETLSLTLVTYPHQACAQPIAIEVTTVSGTPVPPTGNSFQVYDPTEGFACVNAQQTGGCQDYRVRFTCPTSFCVPKCVTRWFDSDNPNTNGGDSELLTTLLSLYPGYICPNPLGIEAQTISGLPASQTGNVFQVYNPTTGFSCVNANQGGGVCADYKVRFTCPEEWCSKCRTPWFDRDNPGGVGDYETLSLTLVTYPHQACAQPIAIEVTTISGTPVLPTGNSFQVYDPTEGFACVNAQQTGGCQDYRVRFTCPKSFCLPKCVTRWFDSDNPNTNGGDSELLTTLLSLYPGYICPNPLGIEAQTISGLPASQTGNVFQVYNPTTGFSCVNANQGGGVCADYKVRFICPEEWCSKCRTPWFDRDNPGGVGDFETLSLTLTTYPLQACAQPIAIEVTTVSGTPVLPGSNFQVYDPLQGFECVNVPLSGWNCQDYKVRYTCPQNFCKIPVLSSLPLDVENMTALQV
ncbi:mucin-5AC isoform X6 [Pimephales promelas]|uniref:mucin-5AC isoform X6 n=1 Tax=Pimephales promelas TaxID=90988 RepID=UPI001955CD18|nr:mucin-5AC isoform X6 [Pimephales promelas]XP_039507617.1 mucin-5AC isoform X6 [Pimephales promelas]